jgi:arginase
MNRFLLTPFFLDRPEPRLQRLARPDWTLNQPNLPDGTVPCRLAALSEAIAAFTERSVRLGQRPVSVAGDCCAAIGVITGLQRAGTQPRLLWLDAHGDFNTPDTSPSGFLGGMPLAMLVGRGDQTILERLGTRPLDEAAVALCDARDLDPREREALASSRVAHLASTERLDAFDFGPGAVHVHIDADILNPLEAPAMLYPAAGGPGVAALEAGLRRLVARWRVISVSLTTWALDRDQTGDTEVAVRRVLDAALSDDDAPLGFLTGVVAGEGGDR